ncbi:MAG: SMP-30/gluconolactonase/LRE family protein [Propionibacteriaceae bacterium]|jgi:sugar lactone lactonase YvrE|nr:SMP-30/gluconolactonase/LRE family protein [Propionibacteriaceae bacterium]
MTITTLTATPRLGRLTHGEGPLWDPTQGVLNYVDINGHRIHRYWPESDREQVVNIGREVCDIHHTSSGRLLVAVREGVALGDLESGLSTIAAPLADSPDIRTNDGNVDPAGRYYIGTMAYDFGPGRAVLYRLEDGVCLPVLEGLTISNGIDWAPDGRMFFIDSPTGLVECFDYDLASGDFSNRRSFAEIDADLGIPDGMTIDRDGGVWVAVFGGGQVRRYTPDGELDMIVEVPGARKVTACAFGGSDFGDLYITTSLVDLTAAELREQPDAGRLHQVRPGCFGKPATPYPDEP